MGTAEYEGTDWKDTLYTYDTLIHCTGFVGSVRQPQNESLQCTVKLEQSKKSK